MATAAPDDDRAFFGHPRGLATLFLVELWERFSYYGMRAFLVVFIATPVAKGGLGETKATAGIIYALYGALVYLMSLPGGWVADRLIGQQRAVLYGGYIIMAGHIVLAIPSHDTFYAGLGLIILGTGLLKPNASTLVGQLYSKDDIRRDGGYSIYYMGINIGAFVAPLACGFLAQSDTFRGVLVDVGIDPNAAWHFGFGAAAVGMALGIVTFTKTRHYLGAAGRDPIPAPPKGERSPLPPAVWVIVGAAAAVTLGFALWRMQWPSVLAFGAVDGVTVLMAVADTKAVIADIFGIGLTAVAIAVFVIMYRVISTTRDEKNRVLAMAVLFFGCLSFFGIFEQAGSTLSFFAEERTRKEILGLDFPSSYWQFVNAGWVILLAPLFTWLWTFWPSAARSRSRSTSSRSAWSSRAPWRSCPSSRIPRSTRKLVSPAICSSYYFFASVRRDVHLAGRPVGDEQARARAPRQLRHGRVVPRHLDRPVHRRPRRGRGRQDVDRQARVGRERRLLPHHDLRPRRRRPPRPRLRPGQAHARARPAGRQDRGLRGLHLRAFAAATAPLPASLSQIHVCDMVFGCCGCVRTTTHGETSPSTRRPRWPRVTVHGSRPSRPSTLRWSLSWLREPPPPSS
jgi:POT family proton-dependent oligopeptide transporter